jgi:hypothetical protein
MCMSCGCGEARDDHEDPDNITEQDTDNAAATAGISKEQAADNIRSCC